MAPRAAGRLGADALGDAGPLTVRGFFGLPLPEAHRQALEPFLARCAASAPRFRWVPAANLHLTIRFLGRVERPLAESIAAAVASDRPAGFDLRLGGMGVFKRGRLARVVWLGLAEGEEPASRLAAMVEKRCVEAGLEPESRRFNSHLTLARARERDGAPPPELAPAPDLPAWRADELVLYRSHLGRGGSVYEPLTSIRLP